MNAGDDLVLMDREELQRLAHLADRDGDEHGIAHALREALASAPQPTSSGEVRAKPIEWMEDGGEWCDRHHGFHIARDVDWPHENSFIAAWGEGDAERFPTLEEAQAWCQEAIDCYVREWAVTAPPSAPVGVEAAALIRLVEGPGCLRWQDGQGFRLKDTPEWAAFYVAAKNGLAQQPAADTLNAGRLKALHRGLELARKWATGTGVHGHTDTVVRGMAEELRVALSSQEGDYEQPAAVECPHRTRCDCLAACKYGYAGDGALAAQPGGSDNG